MKERIQVMVMSGVEDGRLISLASDAASHTGRWTIGIGRKEDNPVCLQRDTFISRYHACLHHENGAWILEDMRSKNGTYLESAEHPFDDARVYGSVPLGIGQLFRIGRTWLRLQPDLLGSEDVE